MKIKNSILMEIKFLKICQKKNGKKLYYFDSQIHIVSAKDFFIGIKGMRKNIHYFVKD